MLAEIRNITPWGWNKTVVGGDRKRGGWEEVMDRRGYLLSGNGGFTGEVGPGRGAMSMWGESSYEQNIERPHRKGQKNTGGTMVGAAGRWSFSSGVLGAASRIGGLGRTTTKPLRSEKTLRPQLLSERNPTDRVRPVLGLLSDRAGNSMIYSFKLPT